MVLRREDMVAELRRSARDLGRVEGLEEATESTMAIADYIEELEVTVRGLRAALAGLRRQVRLQVSSRAAAETPGLAPRGNPRSGV